MTTARKHLPVVQPDAVYEENYARRKAIADGMRARIEDAIAACGPGAEAYAVWIERDRLRREPDRITYVCRRDGGSWLPRLVENDERITEGLPLTFTTEGGVKFTVQAHTVKGVTYWPFRWETGFQALDEYRPLTPAQMKAAAERRRAEAVAKQEAEIEKKQREDAERRARQPELALFGKDEP